MIVQDIVCGMHLKDNEAVASLTYKGKTYYFCSPSCQDAFEKEPEKYIKNNGDKTIHHY